MYEPGDERFKENNPIVYAALGDLTKTLEYLDSLEEKDVDIGDMKSRVSALANKVRTIGDSVFVETQTISFLWKTANLNPTEAQFILIIYNRLKVGGLSWIIKETTKKGY